MIYCGGVGFNMHNLSILTIDIIVCICNWIAYYFGLCFSINDEYGYTFNTQIKIPMDKNVI